MPRSGCRLLRGQSSRALELIHVSSLRRSGIRAVPLDIAVVSYEPLRSRFTEVRFGVYDCHLLGGSAVFTMDMARLNRSSAKWLPTPVGVWPPRNVHVRPRSSFGSYSCSVGCRSGCPILSRRAHERQVILGAMGQSCQFLGLFFVSTSGAAS